MSLDKMELKAIAKLWLSRKLWMSIFASVMLYGAYWNMVNYLYTFQKPEQIVAFQALSTNYFWALTTIWLGYLGLNGLTTWSNNTASVVSASVSAISEKIEDTEVRVDPKDADDGTID